MTGSSYGIASTPRASTPGADDSGAHGVTQPAVARPRSSVRHSSIVLSARLPSRSIFTSPIASIARISYCVTITSFAARSSGT